ncbi:GNAT family N-acetyltransferase [Actinoalloteichus spitiensis]|uniref:GNAT family N-acetyltransferase n=1 Tax=Actinoalloteichus spitiensis TaxID=252394 RepID=UPI0012F6F739|nr:GNAT family N-acetyltransferase [Actinoalloteichus spitiensis]
MRPLLTPGEVAEATDDPLLRWASQALAPSYPGPAGSAWRLGGAVAVVAPGLFRRDRIVLGGAGTDVVSARNLFRQLRERAGPSFRLTASARLAERLLAADEHRGRLVSWGWMDVTTPQPGPPGADSVRWLSAEELPEAADLLRRASPGSWLWPGDPAATRWAGRWDAGGRLVAVGADSWPAPGVSLIAGVATCPTARGRGAGGAVTGFLRDALLREGTAALMVDSTNDTAIRVYERLGFRYRALASIEPAPVPAGPVGRPGTSSSTGSS